MKKLYILFMFFFFFLFSCVEDKGSYDYHDINEVTISGMEARYNATQNYTRLVIEPEIKMTDGNYLDSTRFEYFWLATVSYRTRDTIGYGRTLDYLVDLAPQTYQLNFKVRDKETDIIFMQSSSLIVGNAYVKGILLTGENEEGNVDIEMISMVSDTIIVKDLMRETGLPSLQTPINFVHTGYSTLTSGYKKLWLFTGAGAHYLDLLSLETNSSKTFSSLVFSTDELPANLIPVTMAPQVKDNGGTVRDGNRLMITTDGYLFATSLLSLSDFYTNPKNRERDNPDKLFKAKPYIMYSLSKGSHYLWYDEDNERFMFINPAQEYSVSLRDEPEDIFPWNQNGTNRTLVYAENTFDTEGGSEHGNSYTIMRDNQGNSFIYKFYMEEEAPQKIRFIEVKSIATDFDKAKFYAFSSNRTVVFYVVDNDLYAYDYNVGNEKLYKIEGFGNDEITMLKFDTQIEPDRNPLYIATYNNQTKGTLKKFYLDTDPNYIDIIPDVTASWSGLTKIKNMNWRGLQ